VPAFWKKTRVQRVEKLNWLIVPGAGDVPVQLKLMFASHRVIAGASAKLGLLKY
jgi:hypothetical protein